MNLRTLGILGAVALALVGCGGGEEEQVDGGSTLEELQVEIIEEGDGTEVAEAGDLLNVLYRGTLADGTEFDSNWDVDDEPPFMLTLGTGQVIRGWDDGLEGVTEGSTVRLSIPPSLGYGQAGQGEIPPNADLFFDIQVLGVVKRDNPGSYRIKEIVEGSGPELQTGDIATVHYTAQYQNGVLFDDTRAQGAPLTFEVGDVDIVAAFHDPLLGMREGGTRKIIAPPGLVYGTLGLFDEGQMRVHGGFKVEYEVELLSIGG